MIKDVFVKSLAKVSLATGFLLLMACATQDSRWSAYNSSEQHLKNIGKIEYNGIGGSGRQGDTLPENGLGGSGISTGVDLRQAQANGLGGSGRQTPDVIENGLGGSGKQESGKAAILGPISAFGSIWVNDRHIQLPDSTEYLIAGSKAQRSDLRLGQMVAVLADSLDDSDYQALEVHLLFNVIADLESIEIAKGKTGKLSLLGQTVLLNSDTRIVNQSGEPVSQQQLEVGKRIAISGLRMPNQQIKATLLIVQSLQGIQLAGPISAINGQYWLGQQKLAFDQQPELDQPLRMHGEVRDDVFIVDDWAALPHHRIFELADEVWLEGFPLSDAEFFIEGFEVQLPEFTDDLFDANDSMRIGIDMDDQEFWMDHEPPDYDNASFDEAEFDEHEYDQYYYDDTYQDELEFDDQTYYPDDYYPYDNNSPPKHP